MKIDIDKIFNGDRRELAKAFTLVESTREDHQVLAQNMIDEISSKKKSSLRIAISGPPGVGKSTFIDSLGSFLIKQKKKVGVLAIDPSSPLSGGSILGDKTRMDRLVQSDLAFIRPSPSHGELGGVTSRTYEMILLMEAAGFDTILIETVGVGQSEYEAFHLTDFFLALLLPNSGDELQGIKKGILELVDGVAINKADGSQKDLANLSLSQIMSSLPESKKGLICSCSAREDKDIDKVWEMIVHFIENEKNLGKFEKRRNEQRKKWVRTLVHGMIVEKFKKYEEKNNPFEKIENLAYREAKDILKNFEKTLKN